VRNLAEQIQSCLSDVCCPLWYPGLAELLVAEGQRRLDTPGSGYSTSRHLRAVDPAAVIDVAPENGTYGPHLRIEFMPGPVSAGFLDRGIIPARLDQVNGDLLATLSHSSSLIGIVPSLCDTVGRLALSVHILHVDDPSYDVSFSDPSIPFSVFVSAATGTTAAARMAEAVIHESMHLQLTLIENTVPLVRNSLTKHYSPWKRELRPVSGIVHALYVFRVIDHWLQRLEMNGSLASYARHRRVQIAADVRELDLAKYSDDLTDAGVTLVGRLAPGDMLSVVRR